MAITSIYSALSGPGGQSFRSLEQGIAQKIASPQEKEDVVSLSEPPQESSFSDLLKGFASDVNAFQLKSGATQKAFIAGEVTDVHQVMIASQEAGLALDLMIEVRNRAQEAFQEIMRIQV
ncbi:MAG: flagellar hook-basal body complex protein FliE [Candidatus Latescibacteria bacterium]|jgi:flagellar hook-basal body complex protein FliE|nr:flagellar hook-basal body complex protein FliE [Candidatus Latescibacterota bacterium]MBT5832130.1 flagellar hook-basal body complex protein FliE [Candidatus Latescibacterota bacterium]